ncbi:MAG: sulfite oxidase [Rhodospirillales bacterium]|nr:sulfite oxidase [Rhodospirillales bacterium]MBT5075021.1 sulfite oxidase [Rhodospirillales bacterium]MBT5113361.1 sulfite oxidase [Rhodospirillales bacterium]MBT5672187.1 sulfite oxidase [Rhodospirillales bacterium]MBT6187140.1 sulfite oxidase [Rhodospirillales bacterium]
MKTKPESRPEDIFELYAEDPDRADKVVFGRVPENDRRGFLKGAGLTSMAALVGAAIPFARNIPSGFIPEAMAAKSFSITGKDGLTVHNDRPVNAETPPHLLDDKVTPTNRHFIRNNGIPPANMDAANWSLMVDGLVDKPMNLSIADLKKNFEVVSHKLTIECGGNGRGFFNPPARGNQWTLGAVACSEWTGVRLADVLKAAGVKKNVVYTAHVGADSHLSGKPGKLSLSRGVPIEKALSPYNLIAFGMNGGDLHPMNGAPLRLVVPGWPGSCSQKWLKRIFLRDKVHDGPKMTGKAYRVPGYPVSPGQKVPTKDFEIINAMPVKSLITSPKTRGQLNGRSMTVRGHAWAGDDAVERIDISIDFGVTWIKANLQAPENPYAWQHWSARVAFPKAGYYEVWSRATDTKGRSQPFAIAWNPKGYLNNSMHRISVRVS